VVGLQSARGETLGLDKKMQELIAVGASVTAGCHNCLAHHIKEARKLGASHDEIADAISVGIKVRGGSSSQMDKFIEKLASNAAIKPFDKKSI